MRIDYIHLINLRFIRNIESINIKNRAKIIYRRLEKWDLERTDKVEERAMDTTCVRGDIFAISLPHFGRPSTGKKVPLNKNIGVITRNTGKFIVSILGQMAVKIIPNEAKSSPPIKESGMITRLEG
jgi:hypothetical protein